MLYETIIKYCSLFLPVINNKDTKLFLESSPSFPSLLSIMQTIRYAGMQTYAYKCSWEELKSLPSPYLLHLKAERKETIVIANWNSRTNSLETYNTQTDHWDNEIRENIKKYWDGVVIFTHRKPIKRVHKSFKRIWMILLPIVFLTIFCSLFSLITIPLVTGLLISVYLYYKETSEEGVIWNRVCHLISLFDCNKVERSLYGTIFGIRLNCLALSFFSSQMIYCIIIGILGLNLNLSSLYLIAGLSFAPITVYSLYSQYKLKKMCPFCIGVLFCIMIEGLFAMFLPEQISLKTILLFAVIYLINLVYSQYLYDVLKRKSTDNLEKIQLMKLKRNQNIILSESLQVESINSPLYLGNEKSENELTAIVSPGCKHCKELIKEILSLYHKGIDFRCNFVFGKATRKDTNLISAIIKLYTQDKDTFRRELEKWVNGSSSLNLSTKVDTLSKNETAISDYFNVLIEKLNIKAFPRVILNNRLMPTIYSPKDISFLIIDSIA